MKNRIVILFSVLFSVSLLRSQVTVDINTDKKSYLIGDYIRVELSAIIDSSIIVNWPAPEDITTFDLITSKPVDTVSMSGRLQLKQEIVFSLYDPGNYVIQPVSIDYKKFRDTSFYFATSDSVAITILSVEVDTTQTIKPIKGIIEVKAKNYLWYYIAGGIILLAGIFILCYYLFFRKKKKPVVAEKIEPLSLYNQAMNKLDTLEAKKLWQKNELKQYYSELTDILREYMEIRFAMKAMESTSDEIIGQLRKLKIPADQPDNINFILELADMAKFAKSIPSSDENIRAMELAKNFVERTRPVEQKEIKQ
ncbi:MAG: hypothetical protein ACHQFW_02775 [Chitinophagales bacterium]